jgi:hypothetical protein
MTISVNIMITVLMINVGGLINQIILLYSSIVDFTCIKICPEGLFGTVGKESPICDHLISGSIPTSAVPLCPCCVARASETSVLNLFL